MIRIVWVFVLPALGAACAVSPTIDVVPARPPPDVDACRGAVGLEPFDPRGVPESLDDFPLGVAAGDVASNSAVLWTRYAGERRLRLRLLERFDAFGGPPYRCTVLDVPIEPGDPDGLVKRLVTALTPGARYDYAFLVEDAAGGLVARSAVGTFRAALPAGAVEPIRFAVSADLGSDWRPFEILGTVPRQDLEFFVFLGDAVYADGAVTEPEYRARYVANWSDAHFAGARAAFSWYFQWDDHEVYNSWDLRSVDPDQLDAARSAWLAFTPVRERSADPERLWRSYRWGDTAEFFFLDCRSERRARRGEIVSPEQLAWLEQGLEASTAVFKIVASPDPILLLGDALAFDRWEGFPAQRDELLSFIRDRGLAHVYFLSADIHQATIGRLEEYGGWELVSGPLAMAVASGLPAAGEAPEVVYANPVRNYFVVTLDPTVVPPALTVSMRDEDGAEFHRETFED